MHGGLGNVVMHVWHVHECMMPAGTLPVHACSAQVRQVSNMMQCSARRRACVCIETVYDRHEMQIRGRQAGRPVAHVNTCALSMTGRKHLEVVNRCASARLIQNADQMETDVPCMYVRMQSAGHDRAA